MTVFLNLRSGNAGAPFLGTINLDTILWSEAEQKWYVGPSSSGAPVSSVFARIGAVAAQSGDYDSDQVDNVSSVAGASVSDALEALAATAGVVSVFARIGAVTAQSGDYDSDQVDNASSVAGATVSDALEALAATAGVVSVFTRIGAVTAQSGDYDSDQVDNVSSVTGASVSDALDAVAAAAATAQTTANTANTAAATALATAVRLLNRIRYVDASAPAGGNGAQSAPFITFQAAINDLSAGGIILVAPGTYAGNVTIPGNLDYTFYAIGFSGLLEVFVTGLITWNISGALSKVSWSGMSLVNGATTGPVFSEADSNVGAARWNLFSCIQGVQTHDGTARTHGLRHQGAAAGGRRVDQWCGALQLLSDPPA